MSTLDESGRYETRSTLGQGGFATVYRAYDHKLKRDVAIKVLHPHLASDLGIVARFRQEAAAAASLDHPNIGVIFDWSEAGDTLYIVMRLLPGRALDALLGERGPLALAEALPILRQMAAALDYAHGRGLVHRDVKPSNAIMDERGHVTLTDFGIAKMLSGDGTRMTHSGQTLGTATYMAPEQADPDRAAEMGPATDQYALAVVAYEMLTGKLPFTGSLMSVMYAHINHSPPDPRSLGAAVAAPVAEALLRALAKRPAERFPSVGAFVEALAAAAEQPPLAATQVAAPPPNPIAVAPTQVEPFPAPLHRAAPPPSTPVSPATSPLKALLSGVGLLSLLLLGLVGLRALRDLRQPASALPASSDRVAAATTRTPGNSGAATSVGSDGGRATAAAPPSATASPAPPTSAPPTPTPLPAAGATRLSEVDGMVALFVPAGSFLMGDSPDAPDAKADMQPQHEVALDPFWIDQHEVTNAQFARCVADGECAPPAEFLLGEGALPYFEEPSFADFPVLSVSWDQATAYCQWAGRRLPTEAEWERAARGDTDTRRFPWGDGPLSGERLNFCDANCAFDWRDTSVDDGFAAPAPVGSYPAGASTVGALDLAGNVWEWVEDWYGERYYAESPAANPPGPIEGDGKVIRGGAWDDVLRPLTARGLLGPADQRPFLGFRCAQTP